MIHLKITNLNDNFIIQEGENMSSRLNARLFENEKYLLILNLFILKSLRKKKLK